MIKKIIDWILGKNSQEATQSAQAPYKVEPVVAPVAEPEKIIKAPAVEVKAKYKKAVLTKMSKKELADLVKKHNVDIKSRATKDEMVKALLKI